MDTTFNMKSLLGIFLFIAISLVCVIPTASAARSSKHNGKRLTAASSSLFTSSRTNDAFDALEDETDDDRDHHPQTCPDNHYLSDDTCRPCREECPLDEIIRVRCTPYEDTVCGPFYEFEFFNNHGEGRDGRHRGGEGGYLKQGSGVTTVTTVKEDTITWRHLCYGLMAALLLILLCGVVYFVILFCRCRRRKHHLATGKTITVADPADPTVYYQAQIITPITAPSSTSSKPFTTSSSSPYSLDHLRRSVSVSSGSLGRLFEGHLRRMLNGGRSGSNNVYVDPMGRVYSRKENGERVDEEDTHPFVRVDNMPRYPLVHGGGGQIYKGVPASKV